MPSHADRAIRIAVMLIAVTLALAAAFARWLPPGSALERMAQWAVLLAMLAGAGWMSVAIAHKSKYGHLLGFLVFVLLIVLLFFAGLLIDCAVRPTGCDV